jgi:ketol-acid reductoisomerase
VGTYEELIPKADMVLNLTPDKQHTSVVTEASAARLCACALATMQQQPVFARCR